MTVPCWLCGDPAIRDSPACGPCDQLSKGDQARAIREMQPVDAPICRRTSYRWVDCKITSPPGRGAPLEVSREDCERELCDEIRGLRLTKQRRVELGAKYGVHPGSFNRYLRKLRRSYALALSEETQ